MFLRIDAVLPLIRCTISGEWNKVACNRNGDSYMSLIGIRSMALKVEVVFINIH